MCIAFNCTPERQVGGMMTQHRFVVCEAGPVQCKGPLDVRARFFYESINPRNEVLLHVRWYRLIVEEPLLADCVWRQIAAKSTSKVIDSINITNDKTKVPIKIRESKDNFRVCVPDGLLFLELQEISWRLLRDRRDSLKAQTPPERALHSNHIEHRLNHTAKNFV